jgi:hypothetical protein
MTITRPAARLVHSCKREKLEFHHNVTVLITCIRKYVSSWSRINQVPRLYQSGDDPGSIRDDHKVIVGSEPVRWVFSAYIDVGCNCVSINRTPDDDPKKLDPFHEPAYNLTYNLVVLYHIPEIVLLVTFLSLASTASSNSTARTR